MKDNVGLLHTRIHQTEHYSNQNQFRLTFSPISYIRILLHLCSVAMVTPLLYIRQRLHVLSLYMDERLPQRKDDFDFNLAQNENPQQDRPTPDEVKEAQKYLKEWGDNPNVLNPDAPEFQANVDAFFAAFDVIWRSYSQEEQSRLAAQADNFKQAFLEQLENNTFALTEELLSTLRNLV